MFLRDLTTFFFFKDWEKEKLLVMSNSYFSHSVLKRFTLQTPQKQGHVLEKVNADS